MPGAKTIAQIFNVVKWKKINSKVIVSAPENKEALKNGTSFFDKSILPATE